MSLMKRADDVSAFLSRIIAAYIGHGPMRTVLDGEMVDTIERLPFDVLEITLASRRKLHVQVHVLSLDVGDRFSTYTAEREIPPDTVINAGALPITVNGEVVQPGAVRTFGPPVPPTS